jgi:hypothetical protein
MIVAALYPLAWLLLNSDAKSGKGRLSWIKKDAIVVEKSFWAGMRFVVPAVKEMSAVKKRDGVGMRLLPQRFSFFPERLSCTQRRTTGNSPGMPCSEGRRRW